MRLAILDKLYHRLIESTSFVPSYSQLGEDVIIFKILKRLKIKSPTYLDIGASDPVNLNNTYLLYSNGMRGVLVEPNPEIQKKIRSKRSEDVLLACGVGFEEGERTADFYIMDNIFLSTFSKESAEYIADNGKNVIKEVLQVPLININLIIEQNFKNGPNVVSIDIESLDYEVLKALDWSKYRPEIFCVETLTYTQDNSEEKTPEIIDLMAQLNYLPLADTYINTIFVDQEKWSNR